jgi:hypothetical protein
VSAALDYLPGLYDENGIRVHNGAESERVETVVKKRKLKEVRKRGFFVRLRSRFERGPRETITTDARAIFRPHRQYRQAFLPYLCAIMRTVMFPCEIIRSMDCCTV